MWEDSNGNGKQDGNEPGIGGVKVTLVNCATNAIVATTTTADGTGANPIGYYNFAGIPPGTYHVVFETPNGYVATVANVGGNSFDTIDSDAVNGVTGCYTLNSGDSNTTVDAGFYKTASLGDRLWVDSNGDGIQNDGTTGLSGQTITLIGGGADGLIATTGDNTTATTTTGADGYYQFTGLTPGVEYQVQFSKPAGTIFTGQDLGGNDALDSDVNAAGLSQIVKLSSGEHNPTIDAGVYAPNIGIDIEKYVRSEYTNGSNEGGEGLTPGYWKNHTSGKKGQPSEWVKTGFSPSDSYESIFGVDVPGTPTLLDALKAKGGGIYALMRHSTAALLNASDGYVDYLYSSAEVIAMTQAAIASANYEPTKDLFDFQNNLGADLTTPATTTTTVVTDWFDADTPAGPYIPVGGMAQFKYEITNTGSLALSNIQVIDDRIASLVFVGGDANNDGNLDVGETWTYMASEYVTTAGLHTNIGTVSGYSAITGTSVTDSDAANYTTTEQIASIGDRVWLDANANGIQDLGEDGIEGVTVNLLNAAGVILATTQTDIDGEYLFEDLTPGDYMVEVVTPSGYFVSPKDAGGNDAKDSDIDPLTGRTIVTTLVGGEYDMTWDAGLYQKASIGDRVWLDCNANGIQDGNEIGLSGVTVKLLSSAGAVLATTTTDFQGNYLFNNLTPGDYAIQVVAPTGYGYTARDQGGDDTRDSDVDTVTGKTITTTLTSGENDLSWDAGLTTVGACVDLVFNGSSATDGPDGNIRSYSQNGLSVNVSAFSRDRSTGTWADAWLGTYGGGLGVTDSSEGSGGNNSHTVDNVGGRDNYVMFEFSQFVMLDKAYLGYVVGDSDMQLWIGNFNSPFTSHLSLNDAVLAQMGFTEVNTTTLTTARWADLNAGEYLGNVIVIAADTTDMSPEDYFKIQTLSVCTPACGLNASIGDRVWLDANGNGIQDAGEVGIAGVSVKLLSSAGAVLSTTTTDANGNYLFSNLTPGDYAVQVVAPNGYVFTGKDQGGNDATDSDVDPTTGKTIVTTLTGGENDLSWDAGLYQLASIGDKVWLDANKNGIQDAGETGMSGVSVNLLNSAGAVIATTTTNTSGNYLFSNLAPGDYAIQVAAPSGYVFSAKDQGSNDALDSDVDSLTGKTVLTSLTSGQNDLSWDAGLYLNKARLGDTVWEDMNYNGIQDAGEAGIAGVTVKLQNSSGTTLQTKTTDANGNYFFDVDAGTYKVTVVKPSGYLVTKQDQGTNDGLDSDINSSGVSGLYTVAAGEQNLTVDGGLYRKASIGDKVWLDANGNGVQDAGEAGIAGVSVKLLSAAGAVLSTTTTDANGNYLFSNLNPGSYAVQVVAPSGYVFTGKDQGGNDATDSDFDPVTGKTITTTLVSGENDMTWDAGLYQKASIGDRVWLDCNANGIQDGNEIGLSGVTVKLLSSAGAVLATTTTDFQGNYLFNNLTPGDYAIQVVAPTGYGYTARDQGGDDTRDSDVDTVTGKTITTTLTSGENDLSWDAGLTTVGACVDLVFNGSSATDGPDGNIRSYSQNGLSVNVSAFSRDRSTGTWADAWLGTYGGGLGVTDSSEGSGGNNSHTVDNVGGRDNYVMFEFSQFVMLDKAYLGYVVGDSDMQLWIGNFNSPFTSHLSLNDAVLAQMGFTEVNTTTLTTARWADLNAGEYLGNVIVIAADTTDMSPEDYFKIQTLSVCTPACGLNASIGDRVWLDANGNGIQDAGEVGIAGVSVKLLSSAGAVLSTTTTDANGNYLFSNLTPGDYAVQVVAPNGYVFTGKDQGGNDATDSDVDPTTGKTIVTTLTGGENDLSWDAGLYQLASIGDKVWLDANKNGIQDAGETGMSGVSVNLLNSAGAVIATTTTNTSGNYLFSNLAPGDYAIQVAAPSGYVFSAKDQGSNDALDSDVDSLTGKTVLTSLTSGQNDLSWDAGLYLNKARLGDTVWEDMNYNGIQDAGEAGISGVKVYLRNTAGTILQTTYTDANGKYGFDVDAGTYQVQVVKPSGYYVTKQDQGSNDGADSDINSSGYTGLYTVTTGQQNLTVDAGLYKKASVGDKVWDDMNHNNLQDASEPGISGIKITLKTSAGTTVASTTTDANGNYLFSNLNPGDYYLVFDKTNVMHYNYGAWYNMSTWKWAVKDVGSNDNIDSDVTGDAKSTTNVTQTSVFNLESGENDMSWDAGITPIVIDLNGDGIQTVSRANSTGAFDLLGTGRAIASGWLSGEDGFLAWDRNGNGRIDDISELFGGNNKGDGYAKLAAFDSNGDGVVDANDAAFADLRIWKDVNGNHQTDAGELLTLDEAGVASLSLAYQAVPLLDGNGNLHLERGSATMADGTEVDMTDVYFGISAADVTDAGIALPSLSDLLSDGGSLDGLVGGTAPMLAPVDCAANDACGGSGLEAMKQLADLIDQQAAYA